MGGFAFDFHTIQDLGPPYGWTFFTPVVQGGLLTLLILMLAAVVGNFPPYRQHKPIVSGEGATSARGNESV